MSAQTALVSLRQTLVARLCRSKQRQVQDLLEYVDLLLNFLDNIFFFYLYLRGKPSSSGGKKARLDVITDRVPLILVEALICIIDAAFLYLRLRDNHCFLSRKVNKAWGLLFLEFHVIMEEVDRIKESSSSSSSSSPSSVIWELGAIKKITDIAIPDCAGSNKDHLKSLQEKVNFLLENYVASSSSNASIQRMLDAKIRDAYHKAKLASIYLYTIPIYSQLMIEWRVFTKRLNNFSFYTPLGIHMMPRIDHRYFFALPTLESTLSCIIEPMCIASTYYICSLVIAHAVSVVRYHYEEPKKQEWAHVVEDVDSIVEYVIKIKAGCGEEDDLSTTAVVAAPTPSWRRDSGCNGRDVVVGLESDIEKIKARLFQESSKLELVSIVGMGGIGKTTLANKVYHDLAIDSHFDVRAWTVVSQENSLHHVLLSLLDSTHILLTEEQRKGSEEELAECLHKHLCYRRYLIVVDDVWGTEICDFLRRHFPENYNNSRVLLTSRQHDIASRLDSSSIPHHMQWLDKNHSWDLLCTEVFGVVEGCPLELESIGKKIVERCGGLPLAIVVIGGLLYKDIQVDVWRDIAEKLEKSELHGIEKQWLDILSLSYNHLPRHLKSCFLYMGVFLAHCEIPISTLIHLWIAEGFLRPCESKTTEEEAEGYLKDLIERNLISISKRSCNGKMRTCIMHDLLRDVCVEKARKEKFLHVVKSGGYVVSRGGRDGSPRSLSIDPNVVRVDAIHDYLELDHVHMKVLNILELKFDVFPHRITQLLSLRYLSFHYDGLVPIPLSIHKLRYLETLVIHHSFFGKCSHLPLSIWGMPNLRHIYVKPDFYLKHPLLGYPFSSNHFYLINLQTLVGIRNFEWTNGIVDHIPNLKKLGISYDFSSSTNWSTYRLENIAHIKKLESLKINVKYDDLGSALPHDSPELAFPPKLKKLSLSGLRIPWESMTTVIGASSDLEALKLRREAFCGPTWKTVEGDFSRLVYLLLEEMSFTTWDTEESHFPRLKHLVLRSCVMLKEIPLSMGDIPTLELIELVDCHDSAVASVRDVQEEQTSTGNEDFKVRIEQRKREVDGMNNGNVEARGREPRDFEVLYDAMDTAFCEDILSVFSTMYLGCMLLIGSSFLLLLLITLFLKFMFVFITLYLKLMFVLAQFKFFFGVLAQFEFFFGM